MIKYILFFLTTTIIGCSVMNIPSNNKSNPERYFQGQQLNMATAILKQDVDEITHLVRAGYDVNARGDVYRQGMTHQWTYLNYAVDNGKLQSAKRLIELGADVNDILIVGQSYYSNLNIASEHGDKAMMQLLIDKGVDMDCTLCASPLYDLIMNNHHNIELYDLLIRNGADVNHPEYISGTTPLKTAYNLSKLDLVDYLLEKGADPLQVAFSGHSFASSLQLNIEQNRKLEIAHKYKQSLINDYGIQYPVKPSFRKGLEGSIKRYEKTNAQERKIMGQAEVERIQGFRLALQTGEYKGVSLD